MSREALFFEKKEENKVFCQLCPHHCLIHEGKAASVRPGSTEGENYIQKTTGRSVPWP